jgi:hypothetical protein
MAKLKEELKKHLDRHGLYEGEHASERHEYVHLILDLNGFKESNLSFRSEEQQIVAQLALFGEVSQLWGDKLTSIQVPQILPKKDEQEFIYEALKTCRKQMLLPLFRHLTLLEVYRDDFLKKNPNETNFTDEGIEKQAKELNKDFLQHKIDVLAKVRDAHLNISLRSLGKAMLTFMTEYDGKLNHKDVAEVFDIANTVRRNFYIKNRSDIKDVPIKELREMDSNDFILQNKYRA